MSRGLFALQIVAVYVHQGHASIYPRTHIQLYLIQVNQRVARDLQCGIPKQTTFY